MKITVVVLSFLFVTGAAFGQAAGTAGGMSAEPVIYEFQSHAGHASAQGMGLEQNLLISSVNVQAHGVRPLWEVAKPSQPVPLGDTARLLRKEHAAAKKADIVWNN